MSALVGKRAKAAHTFDRDPLDWFVEPIESTRLLLSAEKFIGRTWDPACGGGNILKAFLARGLDIVGSDVEDRGAPDDAFAGTGDFLTGLTPQPCTNIVTNPPFFRAKGTEAFIRKALSIATGKVAIFCDIKFLASQRRAYGLWQEHPPTRIWQLSERPSCPPGFYLAAGNEAGGGTADWCWLVWDLTAPKGDTRFGWLRRAA